MKRSIENPLLLLLFMFVTLCSFSQTTSESFTVDHTCVDITAIPQTAVEQAKQNLHIAYGHTSHGSQLITGMNGLIGFANAGGKGLSLPQNIFAWNNGGTNGALDLHDGAMGGDVGYYPQWENNTRSYLGTPDPVTGRGTGSNADVNVIIWSWCGQASSRTEQTMIDTYLAPMSQLEADYPGIKFVYMTGHLDGTGATGNLHLRNEQIRNYCRENNKILFDFADIESYDPDAQTNYMILNCNDNCDYDSDGNGSRDRNWATEWQNSHTLNIDWFNCSPAHSQALNGNLKGFAAWHLWCRLGGWSPSGLNAPSGLTAEANSTAQTITLSWQDNGGTIEEDSFIIQRRVDGGSWDNSYASVGQNVISFTDTGLVPGTYEYRIVAHANDNGSGISVDSPSSNIASSQIIFAQAPLAPTGLSATSDSLLRRIELSWTDNASNESAFVIQRQINNESWNDSYASVAANVTSYTDYSLTPDTYRYRIIARNEFGDSSPSNEQETVVLEVPDSPNALGAEEDNINGTVTLTWTDTSVNETGFVVQRQVDSNSWDNEYATVSENSSSYVDNNHGNGPLPSGSYRYRICAYNNNGLSLPSNEALAQIVTSTPIAPSNLLASVISGNIQLTWSDNSDNENSFILERRTDNGDYVVAAEIGTDSESFIETGLAVNHTYTFRLKARNSYGDSNYSNESSILLPEETFTVRLQDTSQVEDAFLQASSPSTNFGSTSYVSSYSRYVCRFNFPPEIMNKRIVSARLAVYVWAQTNYQENQYMHLYRVTSDWLENSVTYNSSPSYDPAVIASMLHLSGSSNWDHVFYPAVDITNLVQGWVNNNIPNQGIMLSNEQSVTGIGLKASEYNNNARTYLEITYTNQTNQPPLINPVNEISAYEGQLIQQNIIVSDMENDTLTLNASNLPEGATLTQVDCCTWQFSWQTNFDSEQNLAVTFIANDGTSDSESMIMNVIVNDVDTSLNLTDKQQWMKTE